MVQVEINKCTQVLQPVWGTRSTAGRSGGLGSAVLKIWDCLVDRLQCVVRLGFEPTGTRCCGIGLLVVLVAAVSWDAKEVWPQRETLCH